MEAALSIYISTTAGMLWGLRRARRWWLAFLWPLIAVWFLIHWLHEQSL